MFCQLFENGLGMFASVDVTQFFECFDTLMLFHLNDFTFKGVHQLVAFGSRGMLYRPYLLVNIGIYRPVDDEKYG